MHTYICIRIRETINLAKKNKGEGQVQWLIPVILSTQEAEIKKISV
jgi:hypothetical protein